MEGVPSGAPINSLHSWVEARKNQGAVSRRQMSIKNILDDCTQSNKPSLNLVEKNIPGEAGNEA